MIPCLLLTCTHSHLSSFDDHHDRPVIHAAPQWLTDVPSQSPRCGRRGPRTGVLTARPAVLGRSVQRPTGDLLQLRHRIETTSSRDMDEPSSKWLQDSYLGITFHLLLRWGFWRSLQRSRKPSSEARGLGPAPQVLRRLRFQVKPHRVGLAQRQPCSSKSAALALTPLAIPPPSETTLETICPGHRFPGGRGRVLICLGDLQSRGWLYSRRPWPPCSDTTALGQEEEVWSQNLGVLSLAVGAGPHASSDKRPVLLACDCSCVFAGVSCVSLALLLQLPFLLSNSSSS